MSDDIASFLSGRTGFLWDFDGVFYSYHEPVANERVSDLFGRANASGAREVLPELTETEAFDLQRRSYREYQNSMGAFLEHVGDDSHDLRERLMAVQHEHVYRLVMAEMPELLQRCDETARLFQDLSHLGHVVVTHGHIGGWTVPAATNLGVAAYIKAFLGLREFNYASKGRGTEAVDMGLAVLDKRPEEAVFIEDTPLHLRVVKEAYPDLLTVQVVHGHFENKADYVDLVIRHPRELLRACASLPAPVPVIPVLAPV